MWPAGSRRADSTATLTRVGDVDWIIEAVIEQIEVKQSLLAKVEAVRRPGTIITSNTSGIPISVLAKGRSDDFRRHWLGTHFFNPPRYLRLLEIIPTADTDPAVVERVSSFADVRLGKGVVVAKDTPNFIANHIGLFGMIQVLRCPRIGRLHHRRDRCHNRARYRQAEERDVSDGRHRRDRCARPRRRESRGEPAR